MLFMFVFFVVVFVIIGGMGVLFAFFSIDYVVSAEHKRWVGKAGRIVGLCALLFASASVADYLLPVRTTVEVLQKRNTDAYLSRRSGMTAAHRTEIQTDFRKFRVYREMHGADIGIKLDLELSPIFGVVRDGAYLSDQGKTEYFVNRRSVPYHDLDTILIMVATGFTFLFSLVGLFGSRLTFSVFGILTSLAGSGITYILIHYIKYLF